ncbi:MAG: hypothetical protein ACRDPI_08705 [Nocardioidaceae bacterium]
MSEMVVERDGQAIADALVANRTALIAAEARELALVAALADVHNADSVRAPDGNPTGNPGRERARQLGGDGTSQVGEFLAAELGCLLGIGHVAAWSLIRDALDLRHRHPRLWALITQAPGIGILRVWQGRKVASLCHAAGLDLQQARWVDAQTTRYAGSLPWTRFLTLVEAKIIAADPHAAEQRRLHAELDRFVATGRTRELGLTTLIARANAGDVVYFVAMCDRIATILAERGDTAAIGIRRSRAIGILANPALALAMLQRSAKEHRVAGTEDVDPDGRRAPDDHEPDDDTGDTDRADGAPRWCDPTPGGLDLTDLTAVDARRLGSAATVYVHLHPDTLTTGTGVARIEQIGPIVAGQVREWLAHSHVTVRPVLDPAGTPPADCYQAPARLREALHLLSPAEAFPFSGSVSRTGDIDHTIPYLPTERGGPPGQTALGNLGRLTRYPHRVKTHATGWRHEQPSPGVHRWRSRYGYRFQVDSTGTLWLGKHPPSEIELHVLTPLERRLLELVLAA